MNRLPTITITEAVKKDMVDRARREWQSATAAFNQHSIKVGRLKGDRQFRIQQATEVIDKEISLANTELNRLNKNANDLYTAYSAALALKADTYEMVDRFGSQKTTFSTLFSNDRDYVYVAQSRTGGTSHTARIDEQTKNWRCDCKSGAIRGSCWLTKALARGVKLDINRDPYVVDENGKSRDVARFKRQV